MSREAALRIAHATWRGAVHGFRLALEAEALLGQAHAVWGPDIGPALIAAQYRAKLLGVSMPDALRAVIDAERARAN